VLGIAEGSDDEGELEGAELGTFDGEEEDGLFDGTDVVGIPLGRAEIVGTLELGVTVGVDDVGTLVGSDDNGTAEVGLLDGMELLGCEVGIAVGTWEMVG